jgi:photosystem II stability/assembly factor-like uncharacterized protein
VKLALRAGLVAVVAAVAAQAGVAVPASTRLVTTPNAAAFWTPHEGLLGVGRCASTKYACGSGAVELTTDGGHTYRTVLRTKRPVESVQTAGPRGAIVVTFDKDVYRTLDLGRTWKGWHVRPGASFATPQIGLGFRTYEVHNTTHLGLLRTTNGGRAWTRATKPAKCFSEFPDLDLVTPRLGWIVCGGQPGAGSEEKAVFRTRDGGRSWQAGASAAGMNHSRERGGISLLGYPAGISFAPNGFGLMWESRGVAYVTRDGGNDWRAQQHLSTFDVDFGRGAAAFSDGTGFILFGRGGGPAARLVETRDFGRTWSVVRRWGSA